MTWGMVAVGVGTAAASIYSSSKSSKAAGQAADAQVAATDRATEAQLEMYYQSRKDLAPWRTVGGKAITKAQNIINAGPGEFKKSPYYNFLLEEGNKELARSQSARGMLDSGGALREAARYGEGLASTEYQNYLTNWLNTKVNPQLALAGSGQVSAGQTANLATQTGAAIGQNELTAGQARASGYINQANAVTGGITGATNALNQGVNNYLFYDYLKNRQN